jgi:ribosomal protein S27AE
MHCSHRMFAILLCTGYTGCMKVHVFLTEVGPWGDARLGRPKRWTDRYGGGSPRAWSRAHTMVHRAKKAGKLVPTPCERCGAGKVDAHHDDYAKPLQVRWLCRACHRAHHADITRELLLSS